MNTMLIRNTFLFLLPLLFAQCTTQPIQSNDTHKVYVVADVNLISAAGLPNDGLLMLGAVTGKSGRPVMSAELRFSKATLRANATLTAPQQAAEILIFVPGVNGVPEYTVHRQPLETSGDTAFISLANVNLTGFERISQQLFSQCIMCHGGSAEAPAGNLALTEHSSWEQLVGVPSVSSVKMRVTPFDTGASFLWDVALGRNLQSDHSAAPAWSTDELELLAHWILQGARRE